MTDDKWHYASEQAAFRRLYMESTEYERRDVDVHWRELVAFNASIVGGPPKPPMPGMNPMTREFAAWLGWASDEDGGFGALYAHYVREYLLVCGAMALGVRLRINEGVKMARETAAAKVRRALQTNTDPSPVAGVAWAMEVPTYGHRRRAVAQELAQPRKVED